MQTGSKIMDTIGEQLRRSYDWIVRGPVPTRWMNLIERLNAEEDALNASRRRSQTEFDRQ